MRDDENTVEENAKYEVPRDDWRYYYNDAVSMLDDILRRTENMRDLVLEMKREQGIE